MTLVFIGEAENQKMREMREVDAIWSFEDKMERFAIPEIDTRVFDLSTLAANMF
jgi:hypothetical protein